MTADNSNFDMQCVLLAPALKIAFFCAPGEKATHFKVDNDGRRLVLAWNESAGKDFTQFLVPITADSAEPVITEWLSKASYPPAPDIDGECEKSFRIYNEGWGHIDHNHYAFVAIIPCWAMYGK